MLLFADICYSRVVNNNTNQQFIPLIIFVSLYKSFLPNPVEENNKEEWKYPGES